MSARRLAITVGSALVLIGLGFLSYGLFCVITNNTPELAVKGIQVLGNGNETRWLGTLDVLLGILFAWGGVHCFLKREELEAEFERNLW